MLAQEYMTTEIARGRHHDLPFTYNDDSAAKLTCMALSITGSIAKMNRMGP